MTEDVLFGGPTELPGPDERAPSTLRVLITVKAAPNPSAQYGETVCVAGLRVDPGHEGWVRLYPINFRFLEEDLKFKKYDVIEVDAKPSRNDNRRESWNPAMNSLRFATHLDGWPRRMKQLSPFSGDTMCALQRRANDGGASLGLVRAQQVHALTVKEHPGWTPEDQAKIDAYVNQIELFDDHPKTALEAPRFTVHYHWTCPEPGCDGHRQQLLDWECPALQRRLPADPEAAKAGLRRRWFDEICRAENDVFFYVGNQAKRRQTFSILGAAYPRVR